MLWNRRCVTDRERQEQRRIGDAGNGQDAAILHAAAAGRDLAGRTWSFRGQAVPLPPKAKIPRAFLLWGFFYLGWLMGLEPTTTGITILDSTN